MNVYPLGMTQINWTDLIQSAETVIGRSPTRSLDANNIKLNSAFAIIGALAELEQQNSDPRKSVIQATYILRHIHLAFLIELTVLETDALSNLSGVNKTIIKGKDDFNIIIMSGTLADWQQAVPMILSIKMTDFKSAKQRELFDMIYLWFIKLDLIELFERWKKVSLQDNTFALEHK